MTDPIADFLTRVRNAVKANHKVVEAPGSKMKQAITKILFEQGYILAYKFESDEKGHPVIKIALKYHAETKTNAIKGKCFATFINRTVKAEPVIVCRSSFGDERRRKDNLITKFKFKQCQELENYL